MIHEPPKSGIPKRKKIAMHIGFLAKSITFSGQIMVSAQLLPNSSRATLSTRFKTAPEIGLLHVAIRGLNRLAKRHGVRLRQSYLRIAKRAAMMAGRYAHAKQFKRYHRELRRLRIRLGVRDIRRKISGQPDLEAVFEWPLTKAT
jgi:hypothetical protein